MVFRNPSAHKVVSWMRWGVSSGKISGHDFLADTVASLTKLACAGYTNKKTHVPRHIDSGSGKTHNTTKKNKAKTEKRGMYHEQKSFLFVPHIATKYGHVEGEFFLIFHLAASTSFFCKPCADSNSNEECALRLIKRSGVALAKDTALLASSRNQSGVCLSPQPHWKNGSCSS